jgi:hypothetical protein
MINCRRRYESFIPTVRSVTVYGTTEKTNSVSRKHLIPIYSVDHVIFPTGSVIAFEILVENHFPGNIIIFYFLFSQATFSLSKFCLKVNVVHTIIPEEVRNSYFSRAIAPAVSNPKLFSSLL